MDWLLYFATILVCITGTVGHTLTLFVLHRLKQTINKALDPLTHRLMTGLAVCELLFCATAVPLYIWDASVGSQWPFNLPGACLYSQFWLFDLSSVSLFHSTVLAVLRFLAVFKPIAYARVTNSGIVRKIFLIVSQIFVRRL